VDPIDPIDPTDPVVPVPPRDSADAAAFRIAAAAHLARFLPFRPLIVTPFFPANLGAVFAEILQRSTPTETYALQVQTVIDRRGPAPVPDRALDAARLAPKFPTPMAAPLAELGQDLLLPGLDGVPPNTVVPLRTNTPFVEAYMVGLNTEFGRELLWREFPAPAAATYFDRFWDQGPESHRQADIRPLADWADRSLGETPGDDERFVMLLRSELLRRYPHAVVYATRPTPGITLEVKDPIFTGMLEPDVRFFGFDIAAGQIAAWSLVIQEQPSAPRFGVEVGAAPVGPSHLGTGPGDAARVAHRFRQAPVRITIPATVLLREDRP
jgi:hypothetical protein